jgi:hypothetical protein
MAFTVRSRRRRSSLERDLRRCVHLEARVAAAALALRAGEGVFLLRLRVQEHREVAPHLRVARVEHRPWRGADHYPVAFAYGKAEQFIADRAADQVALHGAYSRVWF